MLLNLRYQLDVCVGANTVRPSKKQTHGNNKVRQQKILPDNPEFTANPEHGRTLFAPTVVRDRFYCRKIATLGAYTHLCSALLIPHFSLLTPHSSLLIPHSSFLIPHSSFLIPHSSFLTPHLNSLLHSPTL